eukprot:TRINITY_DN13225_c0_g1_i1.p3 TRINITY_DN13225_c0_g1~~TRINITY_DN13225_c0_g1_i1.p3  ORF type:complete len:120 (+),score=24.50 TRINITY_DN13225_c0_g1_i1:60-419(+)
MGRSGEGTAADIPAAAAAVETIVVAVAVPVLGIGGGGRDEDEEDDDDPKSNEFAAFVATDTPSLIAEAAPIATAERDEASAPTRDVADGAATTRRPAASALFLASCIVDRAVALRRGIA